MAKKEQYTSPIKCECGNSGSAEWEENENPVYGHGNNTRLLSVSGEFIQMKDNEIKCVKCSKSIVR